MQNEKSTTIEVILATCKELNDAVSDYCDVHFCADCEFKHTNANCRYLINLIMLLNGYRMGTCDPSEKKLIDDYMKEKFPAMTVKLQHLKQ